MYSRGPQAATPSRLPQDNPLGKAVPGKDLAEGAADPGARHRGGRRDTRSQASRQADTAAVFTSRQPAIFQEPPSSRTSV